MPSQDRMPTEEQRTRFSEEKRRETKSQSSPSSAAPSFTGSSVFGVFRIEPSLPSLRTSRLRREVVSGVSRATTVIRFTPGRSGASNSNAVFFGSAPSRFDLKYSLRDPTKTQHSMSFAASGAV